MGAPTPRNRPTARGAIAHSRAAAAGALALGAALWLAVAGCGGSGRPVIERAAYSVRTAHREASEGRDSAWVRLEYPDFLGARSGEALDSLRAVVREIVFAAPPGAAEPAANPEALMDRFVAGWNADRRKRPSRVFWELDRRVEVLSETLGVVSLAAHEYRSRGDGSPSLTIRYHLVDADRGHRLRFSDLLREAARDSLSAAVEPYFRTVRDLAPDSSLAAAGFFFPGGRFRVNDNLAFSDRGVVWHFDPGEIVPFGWGPTDFAVPYGVVRPFARAGGPLARAGRR